MAETKINKSEINYDAIYPVGAIYMSVVSTNPNTLFPGTTWAPFAAGRTLVGIDAGQAEFDTVEETGGAKDHWHWQTVGADGGAIYAEVAGSGSGRSRVVSLARLIISGSSSVNGIREDGTYDASSLQPYIVTYMWKRTA